VTETARLWMPTRWIATATPRPALNWFVSGSWRRQLPTEWRQKFRAFQVASPGRDPCRKAETIGACATPIISSTVTSGHRSDQLCPSQTENTGAAAMIDRRAEFIRTSHFGQSATNTVRSGEREREPRVGERCSLASRGERHRRGLPALSRRGCAHGAVPVWSILTTVRN